LWAKALLKVELGRLYLYIDLIQHGWKETRASRRFFRAWQSHKLHGRHGKWQSELEGGELRCIIITTRRSRPHYTSTVPHPLGGSALANAKVSLHLQRAPYAGNFDRSERGAVEYGIKKVDAEAHTMPLENAKHFFQATI
jgi:hypothetical protein